MPRYARGITAAYHRGGPAVLRRRRSDGGLCAIPTPEIAPEIAVQSKEIRQ